MFFTNIADIFSRYSASIWLGIRTTLYVSTIGTACGFAVSIILLASIREKMEYNDIPEAFQGTGIVVVTAGLMAIAFCGFAGVI